MKITIELTGKEKHEDIHKAILNALYGTMAHDIYHRYPKTLYMDTDSIPQPELIAIANELEQIHADNEAIEVEVARIEDETDERINKLNKHCEELRNRINTVDNATGKTFNNLYKKFNMLHNDMELETVRINAQAETIQKLCKVIKFMLPYLNINPLSKKYDETIRKTFEDIYKEF